MYSVKQAQTEEELAAILGLRYKILRRPWNQPAESATDELEDKSVNAFIQNANGTIIACGRLQENEHKTGQIRFMAVDDAYQGQGLGKLILDFLEQKAISAGLIKIELQARENALGFYLTNGYAVKEKTFLLWNLIQHYLMEKKLKNTAHYTNS
jgi:N-acetylglutamate synthase-like GNAT family acetyltransferase